MIRVCDAIMGTGKSSAAITFIREHPDRKYLYVSPYLDEAKHLACECPESNFVEPWKDSKHSGSKVLQTIDLMKDGRNVATTHQALRLYRKDMYDVIRDNGYTLILDECLSLLEQVDDKPADVKLLIDSGYIKEDEDGVYRVSNKWYGGTKYKNTFRALGSRDIVHVEWKNGKSLFYWKIPPELLTAFDDVFVLTYMFDSYDMSYMLSMYDIPYTNIGISKDALGVYRFSETEMYKPEYLSMLKERINILDNERMNNVGRRPHDLSMAWFAKNERGVDQLKKNLNNFFGNLHRDVPSNLRMWSTYSSAEHKLKGKGYTKGFVSFNARATNAYRDKTVAAYCVNLFMNVGQKLFYQNCGVDVDEDLYALSSMIQWIWRTAIRDGKEIWLYVPSKRMRDLLIGWIDDIGNGISYGETPCADVKGGIKNVG